MNNICSDDRMYICAKLREELCVVVNYGLKYHQFMIIRKKYEYTGKCIKNNDKLLNVCKSNAKYTIEFLNNCIQYIFAK